MSVADNADWGRTVETAACERWPLEHVAGDDSEPDWFDARFVAPLETELAPVPIVEAGTPVEVKSCRRRYQGRYGRWWIKRESHEQLLEAGGEYVLAVTDRSGIVRMSLLDAETVDCLFSTWWGTGNGGKDAEEYRQVPWTAVFDDLVGQGGEVL
ncbi:hypothetical protein Halru_2795 [Halovivax ruber XH-70]|uniref:PD(D/E)XK endonuclease domain-containing protein n=1 Tax=Halovivax ruber (strain DSM 18193 / JCM 13892 / XH-70) TaxID=797302 RepID=L0IGN1_HALRX|nr:hypothetical protein [Halovivax ruber]AGB17366.1 hypothetical protein Halru_2795 [Halovivax ruber XH-70]